MAASGFSPDLEACGGFFPRASAEAARRPSLAYEQTLIVWDEAKKTLKYHYFTTAGFTTEGTITVEGTILVTHEKVAGSAGGVTEVRGRSEMKPDGTFLVKTEYLKEGSWVPARETAS